MLRYTADRRTIAFILTYFGLTAALWVWDPAWPVAVPMVVALMVLSWICAVITHNVVHCPVFRAKRANKVFQVFLTMTYGHPVSSFVPGHNLSHHRFTETARDVMRTSKARHSFNLLNLFSFAPSVGGAIFKGEWLFTKAMRRQRPSWFRQMSIEFVVLWSVSLVLLVIDWRKFLVYFYLPHAFAAWGIITINLLQHDGCDAHSEYNHSRNFTGKLFGWFTFNNGWHTAHHIKPGLHWSLLPAWHDENVAPHMDARLDEPSFFKYVWRAYLWKGGQRLRYDGTPVVIIEPLPDENWVPTPKTMPADLSLGAEA